MKAQEWATRQKDAAEELAAIAKAKEVLESGVKVFLEVSSRHLALQSAAQPAPGDMIAVQSPWALPENKSRLRHCSPNATTHSLHPARHPPGTSRHTTQSPDSLQTLSLL